MSETKVATRPKHEQEVIAFGDTEALPQTRLEQAMLFPSRWRCDRSGLPHSVGEAFNSSSAPTKK